jgi:ABC-type Fe3+/spermidine/putrescine transport system ATPase subunit
MTTPLLQVVDLHKTYPPATVALAGVSLEVASGEIVCLLGPSGCGKTTLLRIVAGLEAADRGQVLWQGRDLTPVPVHRRGFGFMFQDFALFPHRTVAENIAFGLHMAGWERRRIAERVAEMLDLVNLPGYGGRSIFALSGGERQRVALARSLAPGPALLMLDEPLGSLDRVLREELLEELRAILRRAGVTAIYVTHDQEEALALGDRIVIMRRGRIEQIGAPELVYRAPQSAFVARFLGFSNLLAARRGPDGLAATELGVFPLRFPADVMEATLLIRPEAARLAAVEPRTAFGVSLVPSRSDAVFMTARLADATYHGDHYRVQLDVPAAGGDIRLAFRLPAYQRGDEPATLHANALPPLGAPITLTLACDLIAWLPPETNDDRAARPAY